MDPLTHALAGSLIADVLPFSRRLGPKAPLAGVIAAMAPDIDMLPAIVAKFPPKSLAIGDLLDWGLVRQFHRAYTHSFLTVALASVPLGWLAWRWSGKKGVWSQWSLLILLALFSHIVLDLVTIWGVRAYLPLSGERAVWGGNFRMFDPSIALALALVFIINHVPRNSPADPESRTPEPGGWRRCAVGLMDRLDGSTLVGWLGLALVAGRIIIAGM